MVLILLSLLRKDEVHYLHLALFLFDDLLVHILLHLLPLLILNILYINGLLVLLFLNGRCFHHRLLHASLLISYVGQLCVLLYLIFERGRFTSDLLPSALPLQWLLRVDLFHRDTYVVFGLCLEEVCLYYTGVTPGR